jgi:hypothetical protein
MQSFFYILRNSVLLASLVLAGMSSPGYAKDERDNLGPKGEKSREIRPSNELPPPRFQRLNDSSVPSRGEPKAMPPDHGRKPPLNPEQLRPEERADLRRQLRNQPADQSDRFGPDSRLSPEERRQLREHLIDIRRKRIEQIQSERPGRDPAQKSNSPNPYLP